MKKRVVIVGGGISGLMASWVMRRHANVVLIEEANHLGGQFLTGGLRFLHLTDAIKRLVKSLDLPYSTYSPRGGLLLRGKVLSFPKCFYGMKLEERKRIQCDHWIKSRCTSPLQRQNPMPEVVRSRSRTVLRCENEDLVARLADGLEIERGRSVDLGEESVRQLSSEFDFVVVAAPVHVSCRLNRIGVVPNADPFSRYEYVYTPYTPAGEIQRLVLDGDGYVAETSGTFNRIDAESDLSFLFPGGYFVRWLREGLPGHVLPPINFPTWPKNVMPVGARAEGVPGLMATNVLDRIRVISAGWF